MKAILFAILQVVLASGILYGYYYFMLRNRRFHQYNRFYLLASVGISILIPFLNIPVYFEAGAIKSSVVLQTLQTISSPMSEYETIAPSAVSPTRASSFNWDAVLYGFYLFAFAFLLIRILLSLTKIRKIIKNNPVEELDGIRFINTMEPGTPYSFFRWLFWNKRIELRSEKGEQIFRHELFHIHQRHSLDILFMELITAICWINPFFHLIKKEQKAIHEFLADQFAVHKTNKWEYAELLVMQALNTQQRLVNPFFHNQIKRRIAMITNPQKTSYRYLRKLLVLPVAATVMTLFAFKYKNKNHELVVQANNPLVIVVDAGHGGIDPGARASNSRYTEAQLNLELAKTIQSLAPEYNVSVIMTRENDQLPGGASTIKEGLMNRVAIANKANAAAFVSVHLNNSMTANQTAHSGFQAYITRDERNVRDKSLASAILGEMSGIYKTDRVIKQRQEFGVYVLDKATCPSIILECGYLSNPNDVSFVEDGKNQEKIARAILGGIVKYSNEPVGVLGIPASDTTHPLIVLNGKQKPGLTISELDKEITAIDIVHVNILKGAAATAKYGAAGKNGVIELQIEKNKSATNRKVTIEDVKVTVPGDRVFEKVEIEAAFPGGETGWKKYLERNLDAGVGTKNNAEPGTYTVYIQFIVGTDGSISDVKPLTNHGFGMEKEAIRIIKYGPKWVPAIQNGKNVNAYRKQPINFVVGKTVSQNLPLDKIRAIEQDKTDQAGVLSQFGEPTSKSIQNNFIIWTYEAKNSRLDVQFSRDNERVTNFRFNAITNQKKENIEYEKAKTIKENQTTFTEVEKLFGQPYQVEINNNDEYWTYEGYNSRLSVMSADRKKGVIRTFVYNN